MSDASPPDYREAHKRRLSWMPWLWDRLKPAHRAWAQPWQDEVQAALCATETVTLGPDCFLSPEAAIFGEPHRGVVLGAGCRIAAHAFLHGPLRLGDHVSVNAHARLDGKLRFVSSCGVGVPCQTPALAPSNAKRPAVQGISYTQSCRLP